VSIRSEREARNSPLPTTSIPFCDVVLRQNSSHANNNFIFALLFDSYSPFEYIFSLVNNHNFNSHIIIFRAVIAQSV
jgi:hypothetical protein